MVHSQIQPQHTIRYQKPPQLQQRLVQPSSSSNTCKAQHSQSCHETASIPLQNLPALFAQYFSAPRSSFLFLTDSYDNR